ncbi:MAG: hypothetical protein ACYCYK_12710 [Candidatus Dormibacteria bacterium]
MTPLVGTRLIGGMYTGRVQQRAVCWTRAAWKPTVRQGVPYGPPLETVALRFYLSGPALENLTILVGPSVRSAGLTGSCTDPRHGPIRHMVRVGGLRIGYALAALGVAPERIYVDQGLTGTHRARPS